MKYKILYFSCLCFYLVLQSCAIPVAPTGGPKDLNPPKVLKATPANGTRNFQDHKINITFDKYVDLNNPRKEIIITPSLEKPAIFTLRKKVLTIDFGANILRPNYTYTVMLGNSIKDLREGNKLGNYHYVFSTGDHLDSLAISGRVVNALTTSGVPFAKVLLYSVVNDSAIYKKKPDYYGITDKDGNFVIENLKPDSFTLYALNDKNDNLLYDVGEDVAFFSSKVYPRLQPVKDTAKKVSDSVRKALPLQHNDQYILRMFLQENQRLSLRSYTFTPPKFTLKVGKLPDTFGLAYRRLVDTLPKGKWNPLPWWRPIKSNDSVVCWIPGKNDTSKFQIRISLDTVHIDTIIVSRTPVAKNAFKLQVKMDGGPMPFNKYGAPLLFEFSVPVKSCDPGLINILPPGAKHSSLQSCYFADSSHTILLLNAILDPDTNTAIRVLPGAFRSIYGTTNDSIQVSMPPLLAKDYGHVSVIVSLPDNSSAYIFQLVNKDAVVTYEKYLTKDTRLDIPFVQVNTYQMRLIHDANRNYRWDSGDFSKKRQPEKVYYYPEILNVKANWDLLDLKFSVHN